MWKIWRRQGADRRTSAAEQIRKLRKEQDKLNKSNERTQDNPANASPVFGWPD